MKWYLDILMARSDNGMEVYGPPVRWRVSANWKIGSENFIGDSYHTATTHRSTVEIGLSPKDPLFASYGHQVVLDHGHGLNISTPAPGAQNNYKYQGLPEELWPQFERNLSPEQLEVFSNATVFNGTVFPNLSPVSLARVYIDVFERYEDRWDLLMVDQDAAPVLLPPRFRELAALERVGLPHDHSWRSGIPEWS